MRDAMYFCGQPAPENQRGLPGALAAGLVPGRAVLTGIDGELPRGITGEGAAVPGIVPGREPE